MGKDDLLNVPIKYSTKISIVPTSVHILNPEFSLCDIDVMYVDENRNGTDISTEVVEDAIYSLYGVPIVGEWLEDENRFGDHGEKIEITRDKITFKITTKPIGFVTKEAVDNAEWIEKPLPNGHEFKKWLRLRHCILWTGRYEEAQSIIDNGTSQSMEVKFLEGEYKDNGYFKPSKMIFSALCAIGVEPCFEESNIRRSEYSLDSFKLELQTMLDEYKKFTNPPQPQTNNNEEEKKFMDLEKLKSFLSTFTIGEGENAPGQYALIGATENSFTVMDKHDGLKVYTVEYALNEDGDISSDWDGKVEKKFFVVDFETENAVSMSELIDFNKVVDVCAEEKAFSITEELTTAFNTQLEDKNKEFEELNKQFSSVQEKLSQYENAEAEAKKEAHKNEIDSIVADFAKKIGRSPKFLVYKAKLKADEVTTEQVTQDLTLMVGQEMIGGKSASFSYQPQETNVQKTNNDELTSKYGHLLDKFRK